MNIEQERAAFEVWALEYNSDLTEWPNVLFVKNGSGKYAIIRVQDAWEAWQAALEYASKNTVPLSTDGKSVWIEGVGAVDLDYGDRQQRVPSACEIKDLWVEIHHQDARTATGHVLAFARDLLAKYGQTAPEGWIRAIDDELTSAHLGIADASDSYDEAKVKLFTLLKWHVDVATDPAVNGGWKLVPIEPTDEMLRLGDVSGSDIVNGRPIWKQNIYTQLAHQYKAMLDAAPKPEPKP